MRLPELFISARALYVERGTAAAGALHVGILELKPRSFERLDVIDDAAIQIHERRRVNVHFQAIHVEDFVHKTGPILK